MATDDGVNAALALIPYSGDTVPVAGGNLAPEDIVMGSEGVTAYFQFIQNNVHQIASGNEEAVRFEAEQRHREIMNSTIQTLGSQCRVAIDQMREVCDKQVLAMQGRINLLEGQLAESQAKVASADSLHQKRMSEQKAEAEKLHLQRMNEKMGELEKMFDKMVEDASNKARALLEEERRQHQIMETEWTEKKEYLEQELRKASETNALLQDQLDGMIPAHEAEAPRHLPGTATPVLSEPAGREAMPQPIEIDWKARLDARFAQKLGDFYPSRAPATAPLPAAVENAQGKDDHFVDARETADERLSHAGDGGVDGKVPASSGEANALMSGLAELLREMKSKKDDEGKPRVKEADTIAIPDMPTPETYRQWKNLVRELVRSSSDKPDEAWEWIMEVWDPNLSRVELEAKLQNPGKFVTLDTKLLTKSARGDLGNRILNHKEEQAKKGHQTRGRTVLLMFDDYFKTSEEAGTLYSLEDLLKVAKFGDTIADLKKFINRWDAVLAGMKKEPEETVLRDVLLRQIRPSTLLKYDIDTYDRAKEGDPSKTYSFLVKAIRDLIDRERLRENRDRVVDKNQPKPNNPKDRAGLPVVPSAKREKTPPRGRTPDRKKIPCRDFVKGKCAKGKDCPYRHDKKDRSPSRQRTPRTSSRDPKKKLNKEEMAKTPCIYFARGDCRRGDKCLYLHEKKSAAAPKDPARPNSPKPKKEPKPKKSATPCVRSSYACSATRRKLGSDRSPTKERAAQTEKRVTFDKRVGVKKINARGRCNPVIHGPRKYDNVLTTAEAAKKSDPIDVLNAKTAARKLQEAAKQFGNSVQPSCGFNCVDDLESLTCKCCRNLLAPCKINTVLMPPTVATPAPKGRHQWLIDSGSEQDLISESMLSQVGAYNRRSTDQPISFITANGSTQSNAVAEIDLNTLPGPITPYILEQTPSVLSVGTRCMDQGYSFVWPAGSSPFLVRPDGKAVVLKVDGHVPILDDSCPVVSTKSFRPAKVRKLLALPGVSKPIRDEEEGIDEGVNPDDEEVVAVRSRKSADLIVEAQSSKHQFLHFPKNPFCRTCQRARMLAPYARSKGGQARFDTTRFGDHIIADHVLIKANVEGMKGEKVALVIKDIHTQFRYVYPSQSRFAEDCTFAINHFVNGKDDVEVIYTDNS